MLILVINDNDVQVHVYGMLLTHMLLFLIESTGQE